MLRTLMTLRRTRQGFTLIELLIVVAIIGILAAIAIPNLQSAQKKAKVSRALADAKQIVSQAMLYNADKNSYPTDVTDLANKGYISHVYDPFGATATQEYGYGVPSGTPPTGPIWAMSVGPGNKMATKQTTYTGPDTTCQGPVGFQTDYGAIDVTNC